jgi:uncharacterized protein GlcG (DUF336 family)
MKLIRFAVLGAASAALAMAQLPATKVLTVDVAQAIAQESMAKCRADGYKVTVRVVDAGNVLKAFVRDDGAMPATVDIARMKANSVMLFGRASGPPANAPAGAPPPPPILPDTINFMGGVPIKAGDQTIGAVAVSGAPGGDKDAACANFALSKLADRLK